MDSAQAMQFKEVGHQSQQLGGNKLFRNMHIFSQGIFLYNGTAKTFTQHSSQKQHGDEEQRKSLS